VKGGGVQAAQDESERGTHRLQLNLELANAFNQPSALLLNLFADAHGLLCHCATRLVAAHDRALCHLDLWRTRVEESAVEGVKRVKSAVCVCVCVCVCVESALIGGEYK
jgi:hypothetical protein